MKEKLMDLLIKILVGYMNYMPDYKPEFDNRIVILDKYYSGNHIVLELLDGDSFTAEEIEARMQEKRKILDGVDDKIGNYFFEVFIFNHGPDEDKLDVIKAGQFQRVLRKKYLRSITVDLSAKRVKKHYKLPATDLGLTFIITKILAVGPFDWIDPSQIVESMIKEEKEQRLEFSVKTPVLTYVLIAVNILITVLMYLYSFISGTSYDQLLFDMGAKVNYRILAGDYWRFITPIFLHADMMHLIVNCYSLFAIGVIVEKVFGRFRFFTVYMVSGVIGNIFSFMFSTNPAVGASGAIFGLLGTLLYFGLEKPALFRKYFGYNVILTILLNLAYGFSSSGIDNFAHIGGLVGGFLASGIITRTKAAKWYFNRYLYLILTITIAFSGVLYGFNNKQNRIIYEVVKLDELINENDWERVEEKAEHILKSGVEDNDLKALVLYELARAEAINGKYDEAVEHAEKVVDYDPKNGHYLLGVLYYDMRQYELARDELLEAKKAGTDNHQIDEILELINKNINESND